MNNLDKWIFGIGVYAAMAFGPVSSPSSNHADSDTPNASYSAEQIKNMDNDGRENLRERLVSQSSIDQRNVNREYGSGVPVRDVSYLTPGANSKKNIERILERDKYISGLEGN